MRSRPCPVQIYWLGIQEVTRQLGGIRHVRNLVLSAVGIGNDGGNMGEYKGVLETDVQALVQHLKVVFNYDCSNDAAK